MNEKGCFEGIYSKKDFLKLVYFDIQVLERYFEDPKYLIFYSDYRGSIVIDDKYVDEDADRIEYLKDFGLAHKKDNFYERAIVTFAGDLMKLPSKMQSHFYSYYLKNQDDYFPNDGFVKNLVLGEWVDDISIYQALTMEIHYINKMCSAIGIPQMFLKEFPFDASCQNERPSDFHVLLMPTEKKYYDFVITLEKMITSNLNINTFLTPACLITPVEREDCNGKIKGSLTLLAEWFTQNVRFANIDDDIKLPLRELIKERQTPAHKIIVNKYDKTYWKKQNEFMQRVYIAVRNIRLLLANHPLCKDVIIPDYLYDGEHIRSY
jgi:hypothetical protein